MEYGEGQTKCNHNSPYVEGLLWCTIYDRDRELFFAHAGDEAIQFAPGHFPATQAKGQGG